MGNGGGTSATAVVQASEPGYAFGIEVADTEKLALGQATRIIAWHRDYPDEPFTIKIFRRLATDPKDPGADVLIEEKDFVSDSGGFISFMWEPGTRLKDFSGGHFRYYAALYIRDLDPIVVATNYDIILLNSDEVVFDDIDAGLGPAQAIPVYTEISKDSGVVKNEGTRSIFNFTWQNWNYRFDPVVYIIDDEQELLQEDSVDYSVNFRAGNIIFDTPVVAHQEVEASYVFRYFSEQEIRKFAELSLGMMNFVAPYTEYTLKNYPPYWRSAIATGGTMFGLEQIFQAPIYRERRLIFSDVDIVSALSSFYDRLKASFNEQFLAKKARWSLVAPRAISGHDLIAPPRVTAQTYQSWAYLRGRGI